MPLPGTEMYTFDHLAGGTKGGNWRAKRAGAPGIAANEYGYNQVRQLGSRSATYVGQLSLSAADFVPRWHGAPRKGSCEPQNRVHKT